MTGQNGHDPGQPPAGGGKPASAPAKHPLTGWVTARPVMSWIAGIVALALGALASAWAVNLFGPSAPEHHRNSPATVRATAFCKSHNPLTTGPPKLLPHGTSPFVASVFIPSGPASTIFPQSINLPDAGVTALPSSIRHSTDSYDGYSTTFELTLTAHRRVRILKMNADVLARGRPLTGTTFGIPSAGTQPITQLNFDLDTAEPVALEGSSSPGLLSEKHYFHYHTMTFAPYGQRTLSVTGYTCSSAVQWVVKITFLEGASTIRNIFVYEDHNQPFKTTALARHYKAAYVFCDAVSYCPGKQANTWQREKQ